MPAKVPELPYFYRFLYINAGFFYDSSFLPLMHLQEMYHWSVIVVPPTP